MSLPAEVNISLLVIGTWDAERCIVSKAFSTFQAKGFRAIYYRAICPHSK